jgi:hypothetical protein
MEDAGHIINGIGKFLRGLGKIFLYLLWGLSRIAETILSELNRLLKRILEERKR